MKGYCKDFKSGWKSYSFGKDQMLWRDSAALFSYFSAADQPFKAWNYTAKAQRDGRLPDSGVYGLEAVGVETDRGKATSIVNWRHESLPLPHEILLSEELREWLATVLEISELSGRTLRRATCRLVGQLSAGPRNFSEEESEKAEDFTHKNDRSLNPKADGNGNAAKTLSPDRSYWSRLELPFRRLLHDLPLKPDEAPLLVARWGWHTVRKTAIDAFHETVELQLDQSARVLRAVVVASEQLRKRLNKHLYSQKELFDETQTVAQ